MDTSLRLPTWVEVGINGSHMVGSHHMLFEGNESFNYDSDNTHGNAFAHTVFRNHLIGKRRSYPGMVNARTRRPDAWVVVARLHRQRHGRRGTDESGGSTKTAAMARTAVGRQMGRAAAIWKFGYDPDTLGTGRPIPRSSARSLRDGNFDYLTNTVRWDRAAQALPNSLYLGEQACVLRRANPWPWVDPTGSVKVWKLPARVRFERLMR